MSTVCRVRLFVCYSSCSLLLGSCSVDVGALADTIVQVSDNLRVGTLLKVGDLTVYDVLQVEAYSC